MPEWEVVVHDLWGAKWTFLVPADRRVDAWLVVCAHLSEIDPPVEVLAVSIDRATVPAPPLPRI